MACPANEEGSAASRKGAGKWSTRTEGGPSGSNASGLYDESLTFASLRWCWWSPHLEALPSYGCCSSLSSLLVQPFSAQQQSTQVVWTDSAFRHASRHAGAASPGPPQPAAGCADFPCGGARIQGTYFLGSVSIQHSSLLPLLGTPFHFLLCSNFLLLCRDSPISEQALTFSLAVLLLSHPGRVSEAPCPQGC